MATFPNNNNNGSKNNNNSNSYNHDKCASTPREKLPPIPLPPTSSSSTSSNQLNFTQGGDIINWVNNEDNVNNNIGDDDEIINHNHNISRGINNASNSTTRNRNGNDNKSMYYDEEHGLYIHMSKEDCKNVTTNNSSTSTGAGCTAFTPNNKYNKNHRNTTLSSKENSPATFGMQIQPLTQEIVFDQENQHCTRNHVNTPSHNHKSTCNSSNSHNKRDDKYHQNYNHHERDKQKVVEKEIHDLFPSTSYMNNNTTSTSSTCPSSHNNSNNSSTFQKNCDNIIINLGHNNKQQQPLNSSQKSMQSVLKRRKKRELLERKRLFQLQKAQQEHNKKYKSLNNNSHDGDETKNDTHNYIHDSNDDVHANIPTNHVSNINDNANHKNEQNQYESSSLSFAQLLQDLHHYNEQSPKTIKHNHTKRALLTNSVDDKRKSLPKVRLNYDSAATTTATTTTATITNHAKTTIIQPKLNIINTNIKYHHTNDINNRNCNINTSNKTNSNETDDPFLSCIDFNDDVLAALDAAMEARVMSQQQIQQSEGKGVNIHDSTRNVDKNITLSRSPTLRTSNTSHNIQTNRQTMSNKTFSHHNNNNCIQSEVTTSTTTSSSKPSTQITHPTTQSNIMANVNDNEYGDFPVIDFDEFDKIVENRQMFSTSYNNNTTTKTSVITPSNSCSSNSFTPNPCPSPPIDNGTPEFMTWTRYVICSVRDDVNDFVKTLCVKVWTNEDMNLDNNGYDDDNDKETQEKKQNLLHLIDGTISLRGEWYHTRCDIGDIIHICSLSGQYKTDVTALPLYLDTVGVDDDLILIQHPDELITPTSISEAVSCSRRAVLKMRLGSSGLTAKSAVIGQLRHDMFEKCLINQNFSRQFVYKHAPKIVRDHAEQLIGCGIYDESATLMEVTKIQPQLERFAKMYTSFGMNEQQLMGGALLDGHGISPTVNFVATSVRDTEEGTISTALGLKGFVDATVETKVKECAVQRTINGNEKPSPPQKAVMGIELKTSHNQNPHMNHIAQLSLYTLTLRSRYGTATRHDQYNSLVSIGASKGGMLLYLNHEAFKAVHVSPALNEVKSLLSQRNIIAGEMRRASKPRGVSIRYETTDSTDNQSTEVQKKYVIHRATPPELPDLLHSSHSCSRCYVNRECMLVAAATANFDNNSDPSLNSHGQLMHHFTGHLSKNEFEYFLEWERLIDLEAQSSNHYITKAWLMNSKERERSSGKCISSLCVEDFDKQPTSEKHADDVIVIKLVRSKDSEINTPMHELKFDIGSRVVLSSDDNSSFRLRQKQNFGILRGIVMDVGNDYMLIRVGEADFKRIGNMKIASQRSLLFRLDKDDFSVGIGTLRMNMINFLTIDVPPFSGKLGLTQELISSIHERTKTRLPWLRQSIINLCPPKFDMRESEKIFQSMSSDCCVKGCNLAVLYKEYLGLNTDQQLAIQKVMCASDYTLIQGFPGTGKTSTIVFLVRLLVAKGKRILLSSYTHSAVDNLLLKLVEKGVGQNIKHDLVRIGNQNTCHPMLQTYLAHEIARELDVSEAKHNVCSKPSTSNLHKVVSSAKIVGATALTIAKSPLLLGEHFDIVIVDEAGQISLPAILGPLMSADSFVLVGDHEQLPPLVQSEAAQKAGFEISLLKRLAEAFPQAVAQLTLQYRMHEDICRLSNLIVYDGLLRCANDNVRGQKLLLPFFPRALRNIVRSSLTAGLGWLLPILNPVKPVIFVNTDKIGSDATGLFLGLESSQVHSRYGGGGGVINEIEAKLTCLVVHGLQTCGLDLQEIGVICPYRKQLQLLNSDPFLTAKKEAGLEISTIDRYQGRDKEAIILSLVRSNTFGKTGKLLEDYRRMNVAVSRAKKKLVIVGSFETLTKGSTVLDPVLKDLKERKLMETIPYNALDFYQID